MTIFAKMRADCPPAEQKHRDCPQNMPGFIAAGHARESLERQTVRRIWAKSTSAKSRTKISFEKLELLKLQIT